MHVLVYFIITATVVCDDFQYHDNEDDFYDSDEDPITSTISEGLTKVKRYSENDLRTLNPREVRDVKDALKQIFSKRNIDPEQIKEISNYYDAETTVIVEFDTGQAYRDFVTGPYIRNRIEDQITEGYRPTRSSATTGPGAYDDPDPRPYYRQANVTTTSQAPSLKPTATTASTTTTTSTSATTTTTTSTSATPTTTTSTSATPTTASEVAAKAETTPKLETTTKSTTEAVTASKEDTASKEVTTSKSDITSKAITTSKANTTSEVAATPKGEAVSKGNTTSEAVTTSKIGVVTKSNKTSDNSTASSGGSNSTTGKHMNTTTTATTAATTTTTTARKTRRTLPKFDIEALLDIVSNLTFDYDTNLTLVLNETLQKYSIPTCGTPTTTVVTTVETTTEDRKYAPVVAKCFVCGLEDKGIPRNSYCADAFATDFLPLVPIDSKAKGQIARFRKYCKYEDSNNYRFNTSDPREILGRWTGGCAVRWIDLSGVYTQRTCRSKYQPTTGLHFASKRMAKLELALSNVDNGCIISPMATLVPLSRGISLYARFHACVCSGSWCNRAIPAAQWTAHNCFVPIVIVYFVNA